MNTLQTELTKNWSSIVSLLPLHWNVRYYGYENCTLWIDHFYFGKVIETHIGYMIVKKCDRYGKIVESIETIKVPNHTPFIMVD
jgi:hypothetical protein